MGKPWLTIQGEGPFAGTPAVFVRLAGCNLMCRNCDTLYTGKGRRTSSIDGIFVLVQELSKRGLVVLTGGEPFRQPIGEFVNRLLDYGYLVQIETNGTLEPFRVNLAHPNLWIVCSPKTSEVVTTLKPYIRCLKYIIEHGHVDLKDGLPTSVLGSKARPCRPWEMYQGEVMVQPMDEAVSSFRDTQRTFDNKNRKHLEAAVESALKFGWRISLQLHKLLGVD